MEKKDCRIKKQEDLERGLSRLSGLKETSNTCTNVEQTILRSVFNPLHPLNRRSYFLKCDIILVPLLNSMGIAEKTALCSCRKPDQV